MQPIRKSKPKSWHGDRTSNARILLVDDDERNLMALSEALKDLAEIVTATSGSQALRHLLKSEFAVILLDVFMPGMDGYETASLIRDRDVREVVSGTLTENIRGSSRATTSGFGFGHGASVMGVA